MNKLQYVIWPTWLRTDCVLKNTFQHFLCIIFFFLFPPFNISRHSLCDTGREEQLEKKIQNLFRFCFCFYWFDDEDVCSRCAFDRAWLTLIYLFIFIFIFCILLKAFLHSTVYMSCVTLAETTPCSIVKRNISKNRRWKKEWKKEVLKIHRTISFPHYFTDFVLEGCKRLATFLKHAKHKSISF